MVGSACALLSLEPSIKKSKVMFITLKSIAFNRLDNLTASLLLSCQNPCWILIIKWLFTLKYFSVYLLDDIFSGLDGVVAQHIMQKCIFGLLRHTTRVLVAHSPRYLARANTVMLLRDGEIITQGKLPIYAQIITLLSMVLSALWASEQWYLLLAIIIILSIHVPNQCR